MFFHIFGIFVFLLALLYVIRMDRYSDGWDRLLMEPPEESAGLLPVSVVIAARNESDNIEACLSAVFDGSYPPELLEVIVVDDDSDDDTAALVERFEQSRFIRPAQLRLIRLPSKESPDLFGKKVAVERGIAASERPVILTTDADCTVPPNWISRMLNGLADGGRFVAGPVALAPARTVFEKLQALEMLGWLGIAGGSIGRGSPEICNAANLVFSRAGFEEVGGFGGSKGLSSGDDVFLMMNFAAHGPETVRYRADPETVVRTAPITSVSEFVQQRRRWASKARAYADTTLLGFTWLAGALSVCMLICLFAVPFSAAMVLYLLFTILIKGIGDVRLINQVKETLHLKAPTGLYPLAAILQPFYVVLAGPLGLLAGFTWKGRQLRR